MHQRADMKKSTPRWWLRREETCVFCEHPFATGMHVRCVACDRVVCACCYTRGAASARAPLCPECAKAEA